MEKNIEIKNGTMKENKERIYYFDILKIISCIAVIFIHVTAPIMDNFSPNDFGWKVGNFYDSASRFSVPIFIMISGALFLSKETIDIKKLYKKNILRLLVAYIFYTIFYAFWKFFVLNRGIRLVNIKEIMESAVLESHYHLWFLPIIICIYMSLPILTKITNNSSRKEMKYTLLLFFIFIILKNAIKAFSYKYLDAIVDRFSMLIVADYTGYFLLGYYLNKYDISIKKRIVFYVLGIASFFACFFGTYFYSVYSNQFMATFYSNFFITTFFESIAMFLFMKNLISKVKINNIVSKVIINISNASFGIYLVHVFSIDFFTILLNPILNSINPILSIPLIVIVSFINSLILTNIIKKIPIIGKFLT